MAYVGIDIGGMSIKIGFVSKDGEILSQYAIKIVKNEEQEATIHKVAKSIKDYALEHNYTIEGIGAGCPGAINSPKGTCDFSNNLKWTNLNIVSILQNDLNIENVKITNDANAAILGEVKFGAAKNYHNVVMFTLGTGVGGGLYLDDHLYEGNEGKGAEVGHAVFKYHGRKCSCGRRGCLEAYCSASALIKDTKTFMKKNPDSILWKLADNNLRNVTGKMVFDAAKMDDKTALNVLKQYEEYLAGGILSFCNIFRPEVVILGGGISAQGDYLIKPIEEIMKKEHYGYQCAPSVKVIQAKLGNNAGILGAAALVI